MPYRSTSEGELSSYHRYNSARAACTYPFLVSTEINAFGACITIVVKGTDANIEQLVQQLYKLICVQKVQVMQPRNSVERQLLLVKVKADVAAREGLMRLVDIFKAKVLDVNKNSMVLQITGDNDKVDALMSLLEDYGILELVRTGVVALERGDDVMTSDIFD